MLVLDPAAVIAALASRPPNARLVERVSADGDLHAPHLIDVELLNALRGLVRARALGEDRARNARADFAELPLTRYPHEPLADRAWALRDSLTAYDAVFVALAEALEVPLVTCDARLATAPGLRGSIELFAETS